MRASLIQRYRDVRRRTEALAAPLTDEDQVLQSMPDASPTKWHRAHTTWFFETFVLKPAGHRAYDERFGFLFNSYYDAVGERVARPKRGLLSRPAAAAVTRYRQAVDERLLALLERDAAPADLVELGLHHEEQHQELILTDILHAFSQNPLGPVYREGTPAEPVAAARELTWHPFDGALVEIGMPAEGFAFDNERPRHRVFLEPYALASRPISVGEVKAFIAERGYHTPSLWLSDGYAVARARDWEAPLHAQASADGYRTFSLRGLRTPSDDEPAAHLSFWEAEAIARFLGGRLPTEAEWEHAARTLDPSAGNFADGELVARPAPNGGLGQLFGDVWEWTRSSYEPYPGYRPPPGAIGEYNGKFMAQQLVLRGGSCFTPRGHVRPSYRNFWHPDTRFQVTGARLAKSARG